MKIRIEDASASQLATYAQMHLGLQVNHRMSVDRIVELMREANPSIEEIEIADEAGKASAAAAPKAGRRAKAGEIDPEARVIINISRSQQPGEDPNVYANVNGSAILIPRGRDVVVAQKYVEALRHAVEGIPEKDDNDQITGWQEQPKYPFSVIGYV